MNAIKAQALVDFIVKFTPSHGDLHEENKTKAWIVQVDGLSKLYAGETRVVLKSLEGGKLKYTTRHNIKQPTMKSSSKPFLKG